MDVMVDIETLSTQNGAVVLSIGAVQFDGNGVKAVKFYVELDKTKQVEKGRHIDPETIKWWGEQDIDPPDGSTHPSKALDDLAAFCKGAENVWFRGPHFDHVILETLAKDFKKELSWKFYQVRDCRTLDIFGEKRQREGAIAHNAQSDAEEQAKDVIHILKRLKK